MRGVERHLTEETSGKGKGQGNGGKGEHGGKGGLGGKRAQWDEESEVNKGMDEGVRQDVREWEDEDGRTGT